MVGLDGGVEHRDDDDKSDSGASACCCPVLMAGNVPGAEMVVGGGLCST